MKKANQLTCAAFEDLLIQQHVDNLNEAETRKLNQHLENCGHCQQFQNVLCTMSQSITIEETSDLKPDPQIRNLIIQKMKQSQIKRTTFLKDVLRDVWHLLEYRIPVYQGILGILLVILLIWGSIALPIWYQQNFHQIHYPAQEENIQVNQTNLLNSLDILEPQKIGKAVSEDTMLAKFFSPAM